MAVTIKMSFQGVVGVGSVKNKTCLLIFFFHFLLVFGIFVAKVDPSGYF